MDHQNRAATVRERPGEQPAPDAPFSPAVAYFLTFTTYGTWLHGDPRGSVDRTTNDFSAPILEKEPNRHDYVRGFRLSQPPLVFEPHDRLLVDAAIRDVCEKREWSLHALNVRTNHVHTVIWAPVPPDVVLNTLKSWATRRLREARAIGPDRKIWTRRGSTRYLWSEESLRQACEYVLSGKDVVSDEKAAAARDARTLPYGRGSVWSDSLHPAQIENRKSKINPASAPEPR